jgi:hypothetical protein
MCHSLRKKSAVFWVFDNRAGEIYNILIHYGFRGIIAEKV